MSTTRKLLFGTALALALVLGPPAQPAAGQGREDGGPGCIAGGGPAIDVAGHLAIAARTDARLLRDPWRWGAMPLGVTVAPDGSVYWSQYRTDTIEVADHEGNRSGTVARVDGPVGLTFDPASGRLFYLADRHYPRSLGVVKPGGKPEALICGEQVNRPFAIAMGELGARLYWTESINGRIRSAGTDGKDVAILFDDGIATAGEEHGAVALSPAGVAVDEKHALIFWSDLRTATIVRARLDGSDRNTILRRAQGLDLPTALAVDAAAGKLYWADAGAGNIGRASLDGSEAEVVADAADGVLEPYGLAIDAKRRLLYWTDVSRDALYRTPLDEKRVERFVKLDEAPVPADARSEPEGSCKSAIAGAREAFLRPWLKRVRTCVVAVSATKAVMRSPSELALPAATCRRQLSLASDAQSLRQALEPGCDAAEVAAAVDATLQLGAEIVAADLPRAAVYLRKIRSFVARPGDPEAASIGPEADARTVKQARDASAAIDDLVDRLARLDRAPAPSTDRAVPASGQTTSYAAVTRAGNGDSAVPDDGAMRAGAALRYVDNGDGTITDPNTGLMWEKKCDGCGGLHDVDTRYTWSPVTGRTDVAGWLRAINAEGGEGLAAHDDWRVPRIGELVSIVDYERFNPAAPDAFDGAGCGLGCSDLTDAACSCSRLGAYWTDGTSPRSGDAVPAVSFNLGLVLGQSTGEDGFVRAVRGTSPPTRDRFVDNGDGTVTDRVTRLMWEKKCRCAGDLHDVDRRMYWSFDGKSDTVWDWILAVNGEGDGGFAGHDDWRIPNVKELHALFDGRLRDPSIDRVFAAEKCEDAPVVACSATSPDVHWSSTTFPDFPSLALAVGFGPPAALERDPPPWVIRVAGGIEPHEKTLRMPTRAVRGPVKLEPTP